MCFSAGASFGAGVILSVVGVASIKQVREPSHLAFSAIPLIFSVQQVCEGFLWLAETRPEYAWAKEPSTYLFLFFAQVVWPFLVPFSILRLDKKGERKLPLKILSVMGVLVSFYLGICLLSFPVESTIAGRHIAYEQGYPEALGIYAAILYLVVTVVPPFLSRTKWMGVLGWFILISCLITAVFYEGYIISVWCFFAALISVIILLVMWQLRRRHDTRPFSGASEPN